MSIHQYRILVQHVLLDVYLAMLLGTVLTVWLKCTKLQMVLANFVHSHVQVARIQLIVKNASIITFSIRLIINVIDVRIIVIHATLLRIV